MNATGLHSQPLTFTNAQLTNVDGCLVELATRISSPMVMIADISGQLIHYRGRLSRRQSTGLAALAAGSMAAVIEMGQFLGLGNSFQHQLIEGKLANLYILQIGDEILLIVAFTQETTLGMVRFATQQAQGELLKWVNLAKNARKTESNLEMSLNDGFSEAIDQQLDDLFNS